MNTQLLFLHALTPLHAGTGQGVGIVDLPIAREKATNLPFLPGSSLKGALKPLSTSPPQLKDAVFGKEGDDGTGAAQFADARLLLLPIRSLRGTFAYATSPYVLQRLRDDMEMAGITEFPAIPRPGKDQCATLPNSPLLQGENVPTVILEDLDVARDGNADVSAWANIIASKVWGRPDAQQRFKERFCVLDEDIFNFLCASATEVNARIKLKDDVKSVEKGGLWYEENLPAESVLVSLLTATPLKIHKNGDQPMTAGKVLELAIPKNVAQFGGKASVGRGLCRIRREEEN